MLWCHDVFHTIVQYVEVDNTVMKVQYVIDPPTLYMTSNSGLDNCYTPDTPVNLTRNQP